MSSKPTRADRAWLVMLCAAVLLAQLAAAVHATWHASHAGGDSHVAADASSSNPEGDAASLCAFDAAFGQMLGCAPPAAHALTFAAPATQAFDSNDQRLVFAAALPPRSRGPPPLL